MLQDLESIETEAPADDSAPSSEAVSEAPTADAEQLEFESYLAEPQEAGKKGLESRVAPPWYSAEEDEAVPVGLDKDQEPYRNPVDPGNRASDWVRTPAPTAAGGTGGTWSPLAGLPLTELIWVALATAFLLLAGLLIFALIKARMGDAEGEAGDDAGEEEEDPISVQERIERLPFDLRQGVVDFLDEARRLAAAGKYEEALVYLFSHALVQLDRSHRIRLAKGKTNRQYVSEIESSPPLAQLLSELADDFEGVFFGKYPLSQAKYEQNLDRIERFRALLQQASHG
ncbi:MAG TPA: DUF4129 domain-containing protein [Pirellulaceae bacterium]|nr:DUF4129 domain-containing protein [Pirellulaceae bacterium]